MFDSKTSKCMITLWETRYMEKILTVASLSTSCKTTELMSELNRSEQNISDEPTEGTIYNVSLNIRFEKLYKMHYCLQN